MLFVDYGWNYNWIKATFFSSGSYVNCLLLPLPIDTPDRFNVRLSNSFYKICSAHWTRLIPQALLSFISKEHTGKKEVWFGDYNLLTNGNNISETIIQRPEFCFSASYMHQVVNAHRCTLLSWCILMKNCQMGFRGYLELALEEGPCFSVSLIAPRTLSYKIKKKTIARLIKGTDYWHHKA